MPRSILFLWYFNVFINLGARGSSPLIMGMTREIKQFFDSQTMTYFHTLKSFYASFNPGQGGSYNQPLRQLFPLHATMAIVKWEMSMY